MQFHSRGSLGLVCVVAAHFLLGAPSALAQSPGSLLEVATRAKDLVIPAEASPLPLSEPRMALHKPKGEGPFPALVLHHACGGLVSPKWKNRSMLHWAKEAVGRGYVVLLLDSLHTRGVDSVCYQPKGNVNFARGVRDALQAAEQLQKFGFVDKKRIAHAGFSWGAMVGAFASSTLISSGVGVRSHFAAFVSFYPGCFTIRPAKGSPYEIVRVDIGRPLLMLLGGKDTETPPAECVTRLKAAKSAGAPVEWYIYPDATHCWDCIQWDGASKVDFRGNHVVYRYDEAVRADSGRRMFEFLERVWAARQ
jgi:dienelactone hydrolase